MFLRFLFYQPVGEDEDAVRTDLLRVHEPQIPRFPSSPKGRLPFPTTTRCTIRRYSSMRSCSINVLTSFPLPKMMMSLPYCCFSLPSPSAMSPSSNVELFHPSGSRRVVDATYLG